jgi:hypothetical protein
MEPGLIERLERNARFYHNEAAALAEKPERRDNRYLGSREAQTIADLLNEAASALQAQETDHPIQAADQA